METLLETTGMLCYLSLDQNNDHSVYLKETASHLVMKTALVSTVTVQYIIDCN